MKYMLLIYFDQAWDKLSLTERQQIFSGQTQLSEQLRTSGQYLGGHVNFMSMDKKIGGQFEKGLADLKSATHHGVRR